RERFGWKVVYDANRAAIQTGEQLVDGADLTVVSPEANASDAAWAAFKARVVDLYPKVTIVLLTYNGLDYNRQCLGSIFGKTAYPNFEVVIVDNGSTDGTGEFLAHVVEEHPNVRVIQNATNVGY